MRVRLRRRKIGINFVKILHYRASDKALKTVIQDNFWQKMLETQIFSFNFVLEKFETGSTGFADT